MADEEKPAKPAPVYGDLIVKNPPCPVCWRDRFHREGCPRIGREDE